MTFRDKVKTGSSSESLQYTCTSYAPHRAAMFPALHGRPMCGKPAILTTTEWRIASEARLLPSYTRTVVLPATITSQTSQNCYIEGTWQGSWDSSATSLLRNTPRRHLLVAVMHVPSLGSSRAHMPWMQPITCVCMIIMACRSHGDPGHFHRADRAVAQVPNIWNLCGCSTRSDAEKMTAWARTH